MALGRVDRYELLELIGQGSFGSVYRARHVHTGQLHALKLARGNIERDAAAASLRHPNIVSISDGGTTPSGESFVVMELLAGQTVAQLISQRGPMTIDRAANIARQMLDALSAAHASNIVHRDIKPSNVFVVNGELVKIIDFGISKGRREYSTHPTHPTLPGVAMGTPGYMAPEQLGDARRVDARADISAVGVTLFEMLTARKPIEADSFETWMRRLTNENATPIGALDPRLPPALSAVVDRALARNPNDRWPSAIAMRQALEHAIPSSLAPTVLAPSPLTHPPPAPPSSALPWIAAGLAGLLAVIALAVTGGLFYLGRERVPDTPKPVAAPSPSTKPTATATATPITKPTATPTASPRPTPTTPPPPPAPGPVKAVFGPPRIVGDLRQDGYFELAEHARARLDQCNPDRTPRTVRFDMHVHDNKITLTRDSVNDDPGDPTVASCCGQAMRDAQWPAQRLGADGIYSSASVTWK
jgi:serine/threonine-protein kinase